MTKSNQNNVITFGEVIRYLETIAPPMYQEDYDNAGLITGDPGQSITGVITCLDATEAVIEEAIAKGCNLVVAHHPIVFRGLKKITGRTYVERVIRLAIKNDIGIYAIHTNLDNVYAQGVNSKIAEKLGLSETAVLAPKNELKKIVVFVGSEQGDALRSALFEVGAGATEAFSHQSFAGLGVGTLNTQSGVQVRLETLFHAALQPVILRLMQQDFPGLQYDIIRVENPSLDFGSGMIGLLEKPLSEVDFLKRLKTSMKTGCVRHTPLLNRKIHKVAICGGAGSFLLSHAIARGADAFVTADFKYHEFFDADGRLLIADIGHFESEQYTIELLFELISKKYTNFASHLTEVNTNPVNYF